MRSGYWQDLATGDFAGIDPETAIALLPLAAIEQHGPHLPLSTDAVINQGVVARLLERLADEAGYAVLVLPVAPVGHSPEHGNFPGTLSHAEETLLAAWTEIGAGVAAAGLRKLILFNSHGGQPQLVDLVAQRLRMRQNMLVMKVNSFRLGCPDGLFDADELRYGIHGGAVETSIMLHLRPDLVRTEAVRDFPSLSREMDGEFRRLRPGGTSGFAWAAEDLNPAGVVGDPTRASAEKGAATVDHLASAVHELAAEAARFPLARLAD